MDNPRKDYQWANPHKFESNCPQLYPIDRMLTFYFTYEGKINLSCLDSAIDFFKKNEGFQNQITQFLIQMIEKVCSVAFNILANKKCNENQAKCYAAKNMLQNIKYLCLKVSKIIKDSQQRNFKQKEKRTEKIEKITRDITSFICQQIKVYIQQIFPKYPSTPLSGYSQKLKNAIRSIDRRQDYTYDFLHIHKLQIGDAKNPQELISQIMIFLNKVKSAPYEKIEGKMDESGQQDEQQQTYEECFQKFNRNLVWIISQKDITQKMIKGIHPLTESKDKKVAENNKVKEKQLPMKNISQEQQAKSINAKAADKPQEKSKQDKIPNILLQFLVSPSYSNLLTIMTSFEKYQRFIQRWQLIQKYQQELKNYESEHKFATNAKIQMNTQQFQKSQINNAELRFKSPALLRVVVKWVEDLQETLKDTKKYIRDNGFKFKFKKQGKKQVSKQRQKQISLNEDLVTLDQQKRKILESAIKKASKSYKKQGQKQNKNKINMFLVDSLMEQEQQTPQYNFQGSLKLSSQVNAYIGKSTVEQLIKLIGIFESISQHLEQYIDKNQKNIFKNIYKESNEQEDEFRKRIQQLKKKLLQEVKRANLLSNRIGDLLRSKIVCSETQFIKLLTLLYQLDNYCENAKQPDKNRGKAPFFKIIRIKNKLKDTTNNVHINYMFHGKIQCQLQICFLNNKKVQKANQTMHHFLYELKRGIYGVVPQLANIVNQNDPICQHNQSSSLRFIKYSQKVFKHKYFQERTISQSQKNKYVARCIYQGCNQFSLQSSKRFIKKDGRQHRSQCLKCYVQKNQSQQNLFDALKKLYYSAQDEWVKDVLQQRTELQIQEITENEQNIPGVYLVIYLTQKRIIVKLYIIFKHYKTGQLIIKCLQQNSQKDQSSQTALEFQTEKVYKEHKSMKKLYFKVNRFKLRRLLQNNKNRGGDKQDRVSFYIKNLSKKQIRSLKLKAVKQFDRALLDKQIQNKQQHLRLGQMQSITDQLQEYFYKKQQLVFVQRVYAQSMQLQTIMPISKFSNLKELHLKENYLGGSLTIQNHLSLTYIDLSYNRINQINLNDLKNLKDINLSYNRIRKIELKDLKALINLHLDRNYGLKFDLIGLTSLQNLSMVGCGLQGQVVFRQQLLSLQMLNVYDNYITKLDLGNCPSLQNLNCKNNPPIQLIFNKKSSLKSMEATRLNSLPQFSLDQLQKIGVQLRADQIYKLCLRYLRGDNYLSKQSIFDHIKSNKTQLQKLKNIRITLLKSKQQPSQQQLSQQQSTKLKQWQRNAVGQLLQQLIANLSNLNSLYLIDDQSAILIQHLDISKVQQQIQSLYIQSKTLKSLKLNKVRKIEIKLKNLEKLQILTPQSLKQFTLYGINKSIYSRLTETSFLQQCTNMQSIRIYGNEQPQGVYEFTNLKHLQSIYFLQFSASNMICRDNAQQQPFSQTLRIQPQKLTLAKNQVKGCTIQLSQLTELNIYGCYIKDLKIKFPLKSIQKISILHSKIQNLSIQYYDENEKADLQYFYDNTNSLALLTMLNTKMNSIRHLVLNRYNWEGKEQLRLSSICKKIEQLTVRRDWNKLIVDTSIKAINIQGTIAEFIFDIIVSASNKRQKLALSLSRQCLLKAKFINNTNQVINVTIKVKGFKSVQKLKEKNKGQKIRFTFISEQQEYLRIEEKDISQKYQNLLEQFKQSRQRLYTALGRMKAEENWINKQGNIEDQQQNDISKYLFKCPRYKQLKERYREQFEEERFKHLSIQFQRAYQFNQYKQLRKICQKQQLQEDQLNEFQEGALWEKYNQCIKKWEERHEHFQRQLLNRYCKQVQEDLANMSEEQRQQLQKDLASN